MGALLFFFPLWFYLTFTVWICPCSDHNHIWDNGRKLHVHDLWVLVEGEAPPGHHPQSVWCSQQLRASLVPRESRTEMTKQHHQN